MPAKLDQGLLLRQQQRQKMAQQVRLSLQLLPLRGAQLHRYVSHHISFNPALCWRSGHGTDTSAFDIALANTAATPSLSDHLLTQLYQQPGSPVCMQIAEIIIDSLDEDGYLQQPIQQLREDFLHSLDHESAKPGNWQKALQMVRTFDPGGVAATDLRACLQLQLLQEPADQYRDLALQLVATELEQLARPDPEALAKRLHSSNTAICAALALIKSLEPKPGRRFYHSTPVQQADAEIIADNGQLTVKLLQPLSEKIDFLASAGASGTQKRAARQLLQALQLREQNLLNIISTAVTRQQAMLLAHERTLMQAMTQVELAQRLQLHPSTISRAVRHRHVLWQGQLLPLQSLFSRAIGQDAGNSVASAAIKAQLQQLIAAELPGQSWSDSRLQQALANSGMHIARRTVAKYRRQLGFATASQRNQQATSRS